MKSGSSVGQSITLTKKLSKADLTLQFVFLRPSFHLLHCFTVVMTAVIWQEGVSKGKNFVLFFFLFNQNLHAFDMTANKLATLFAFYLWLHFTVTVWFLENQNVSFPNQKWHLLNITFLDSVWCILWPFFKKITRWKLLPYHIYDLEALKGTQITCWTLRNSIKDFSTVFCLSNNRQFCGKLFLWLVSNQVSYWRVKNTAGNCPSIVQVCGG